MPGQAARLHRQEQERAGGARGDPSLGRRPSALPSELQGALRGDEFKLYDLIWKRTVASQMADAKGSTASVTIRRAVEARRRPRARDAEFAASGTVITFRGFLAAYEEGQDEERNSDDEPTDEAPAARRRARRCSRSAIEAKGHETTPPPRYTEASLVKTLEELGIGRPSTYASIISTIIDRGYVTPRGQALVPNWIAFCGRPAARGALRRPGRVRLHRRDGGRPRPHRRAAKPTASNG